MTAPHRSGRPRRAVPTLEPLEPRLAPSVLPAGFVETPLASGLTAPTAMAFAPDGRLFVTEQAGRVRIIRDGALLPTPFATFAVEASGERGLLGLTFDPAFAVNGFVYVYYTTATAPIHNRVSRVTAQGDTIVPGSEVVLLELENVVSNRHNGGALHFGLDGKLYVAVGEDTVPSNAQTLANRLGKLLRLNADGTIPADNPFVATATGGNRAIWALGLRNPFTFAVQPGTGRLFLNDVGQSAWEEINEGVAGANYGWPATEGPTNDPRFRAPLFAYANGPASAETGCAITGAAFYNPTGQQFPAEFAGDYFFADLCSRWIRRFDPVTGAVTGFGTDLAPLIVDLDVDAAGSLYYLSRGTGGTNGTVFRISFPAGQTPPQITQHPVSRTAAVGEPVAFTVTAAGAGPLRFQWQRQGVPIPGATAATLTLTAALADHGAPYRAVVTNAFGSAASNPATLTVQDVAPAPGPEADFLARLYRGLLGRSIQGGEALGLQRFLEAARGRALEQAVSDFLASAEGRASFVREQYATLLGRPANPAEVAFWSAAFPQGTTPEQVIALLLASPEFFQRQGGTDAGWLDGVHARLLGRARDPGSQPLLTALANGTPRVQVAALVLGSPEYRDRLLRTTYSTFLGRDADAAALAFWRQVLAQPGTTSPRDRLLAGVLASAEYFRTSGNTLAGWVESLYSRLLGRGVDEAGRAFWRERVLAGTAADRLVVTQLVVGSRERRGQLVRSHYATFLGRSAGPAEAEFWLTALPAPASLVAVLAAIVSAPEYGARAGGSDAGWLEQLYQDLLGRPLDAAGRGFFLPALQQGSRTRLQVALDLLASTEYRQRVVQGIYRAHLARAATAAEEAFWLQAFRQGATEE